MDLGLAGRRALVTAASRGLGEACAAALAAEGARVFIAARDQAALARVAGAIRAAGWRAADVTQPEAVEDLVAAAAEALGGIDILVVNAGGPRPGTFASTGEADWEQAWALTLMSAVRLTRAALPHLRRSEQGRVVNLTSATVKEPQPNLVLSSAYRSAVTATARTLATELAPDRITVNNVAPDAILTDRIRQLRGIDSEAAAAGQAELLPMRRFGSPAELGALCAFLCSRQAGYITGQTVVIDGGLARSLF